MDGFARWPQTGAIPETDLAPIKRKPWAGAIRFFINAMRVRSNELELLSGRLPFPNTLRSVVTDVRRCDAFTASITRGISPPQLSTAGAPCLEWREGRLRPHTGRSVATLKTEPGLVVYTDDATEAVIATGVVYARPSFLKEGAI